jgi:uncharacterized membrane protein YkvA (DUF1232 family)
MMNKLIDKLIKEAEKIIVSDGMVSKLIDDFFLKLGNVSENIYAFQDNIIALVRMLKSWVNGEYKNISTTSIIAVVAAILYFVNPLDFIPDFIPIIGQIDDFFILGYLIKILNKEIEKFMAWENENYKA